MYKNIFASFNLAEEIWNIRLTSLKEKKYMHIYGWI